MSPTEEGAYAAAGVDYATLDAAKRLAIAAAASTSALPDARGGHLDESSRGEPAVLLEIGEHRLGFVLECLGTKSVLARDYEALTGTDRFDAVGFDAVAAVVNDCCCVGALPLVVNAYFATGSAAWYSGTRYQSLIAGWRRACTESGAAWGGGESPTLSGLIDPEGIDLAGSAIGCVPPGCEPLSGSRLVDGDEIVLLSSSGLQQNGASLVREIATRLPAGLASPLKSGRHLGDAALDPGLIYVRAVEAVELAGLPLHYASYISGHGLRKLMRADRELTYRIDALPEVPEVLEFLAAVAEMDPAEAYGTLNMGVGFAMFVDDGAGATVARIATGLGYEAVLAGRVEAGPRQVLLEPIGVTYRSADLEVR